MKKIDLAIFDFDGTVVDSKQDIADSVNHTLRAFSLKPVDMEQINLFVGKGVVPLIQQAVELAGDGIDVNAAIEVFRAHYYEHLLDNSKLYPGVMEVLARFHGEKELAIASNKPHRYVVKMLAGLGVDKYFGEVYGGDSVPNKKPAPEMIDRIIASSGSDRAKSIIIGDSDIDIQTGKNAGILTCGATYGFRPRAELDSSGADFLIDRIEDLLLHVE